MLKENGEFVNGQAEKYVKIKHSENSSYLIKERIMSIYDETGTFKDPLWV